MTQFLELVQGQFKSGYKQTAPGFILLMNIIFDTDKNITHWYHVHQNTDKKTFRKMFIYDPTCLIFILGDRRDVVEKSQARYLI